MKINMISPFFILFIISILNAEQSDALYDSINSYLKRYRLHIEEKDLTVTNGVIYLELEGRRTNLKSLVLLGFYSVGRQLQKNSFPFREVQIIVHYEMKNTKQISVTASMESVLDLSQGRINPDQFLNELFY